MVDTTREMPAGGVLEWGLARDDGTTITGGSETVRQALAPGRPRLVGSIQCRLPDLREPVQLRLPACPRGASLEAANAWPVWLYPAPGDLTEDVRLYDPSFSLDETMDGVVLGSRARVPSLPRAALSGGRR